MGALAALRCEALETMLLVEFNSLERKQCLVAVRRFEEDDDFLELDCLPEAGVRVDGKLAPSSNVFLDLGDNVRFEFGSEFATIRFAGRDADEAVDLTIASSHGCNVRRVEAGGFDPTNGKVAFIVEEG